MSSQYFSPISLVAGCALALGLSGCVAAPLAQMAVLQMTKPSCTAGPGCSTNVAANSFGDMSKGVTDSFHKLTGGAPDTQTIVAGTTVK